MLIEILSNANEITISSSVRDTDLEEGYLRESLWGLADGYEKILRRIHGEISTTKLEFELPCFPRNTMRLRAKLVDADLFLCRTLREDMRAKIIRQWVRHGLNDCGVPWMC